jgi:hypothetical protein
MTMLIEHIVYSLAFAIIFGLCYKEYTGRELSMVLFLVIVMSAYSPDLDLMAGYALTFLGITSFVNPCGCAIHAIHNISALLLYAAIVAFLFSYWGFRFWHIFIFAGVGFGAHLIEDALVFKQAYPFFWPLTTHVFGIGIVEYQADLYGIADSTVLIWGLAFFLVAITLRTLYDRKIGGKS